MTTKRELRETSAASRLLDEKYPRPQFSHSIGTIKEDNRDPWIEGYQVSITRLDKQPLEIKPEDFEDFANILGVDNIKLEVEHYFGDPPGPHIRVTGLR